MSTYEYIDSRKAEPDNRNSVVKMCAWLAVSTSGFYHWISRPQSATAARREALIGRVQHFFEDSEGTYGYRRIHADLADEGTECSPPNPLTEKLAAAQTLFAAACGPPQTATT